MLLARKLDQRIRHLFTQHHGRYGSPRLYRELRAVGWAVSHRRVERLMRTAGLGARVARIYRANAALHRFYGQHPNRLPPAGARRPDHVWVGDITYLPVGPRWLFLAVVLDQCSRRVVAWRLGRRRDARLTPQVMEAAVRRRQPAAGLIFHSDRGSEDSAARFRDRLRALGLQQSSARHGPEENAHMEPCFHSLKAEAIHGVQFATGAQLRSTLARDIRYANHKRLHSAVGHQSPVAYEAQAA